MLDSAVLSTERPQKDLLLEAFLWHGFSHGKHLHVIHNMGFLFWFIWSAQAMAYSIGFGVFKKIKSAKIYIPNCECYSY